MASQNTQGQAAPQAQAASMTHPVEGIAPPPPGQPRVRQIIGEYKQTWRPQDYDSMSVSVAFVVDMGEGVSPEDAYELSAAYTGLAQCSVWRRAVPVLERTGRIPKASVVSRVAGNDLETLKWVKDTTGIPVAFRRQLGEEIAAQLAGEQASALDRAIMLEGNADLLPSKQEAA